MQLNLTLRSEHFNPEMLMVRRYLLKMNQAFLAQRAGLSQGHLSKIEQGLLLPTADVQARLAQALDCPESFFLQSDRVYGLPISVHPMFRKRASVGQKELDRIQAELNFRIMHIRRLLQAADFEGEFPLPHLDLDDYQDDIEEIANLTRRTWLLPRGPLQNLTEAVERAGCLVIHCDFQEAQVDGVTLAVPGLPPCIFLNAAQPADRMRFSLAHELGHLVMHRIPNPEMEEQANHFAGAFLMPAADIASQLSGISLPRLAELKPHWRVSMAALLMRAETLGKVTANQKQYLWRQISAAGYRRREPVELDFAPESPSVLPEMIRLHLEDLGYSLRELSTALHLHEHEFRRYYRVGGGHLRIVKGLGL
ncbi:MAG: XRE family transcriptional regulator [Candidatus Competibacteraceae bacterium]